jgi:hypothetical protein
METNAFYFSNEACIIIAKVSVAPNGRRNPQGSMCFSPEVGESSTIHFLRVNRQFVPKSLFHAIISLSLSRHFVVLTYFKVFWINSNN